MNTKRLRLPINNMGNTKTKGINNYTFLVFNSYDNSSYCFNTFCSTYKEATGDYLSHMMGQQNSIIGKVTHDNIIEWEDGSFSVLSILNGHIQDDFSSWVKKVNE